MHAALLLLEHSANPWLDRPAVVAVGLQQLASAVSAVPPEDAQWPEKALELANHALDTHHYESVASSAALVADALDAASARGMKGVTKAAIDALLLRAAQRQVSINPRSVRGWTRLANVAESQGDSAASRNAALRALAADDSFALDPLRQLPSTERATLERQASHQ